MSLNHVRALAKLAFSMNVPNAPRFMAGASTAGSNVGMKIIRPKRPSIGTSITSTSTNPVAISGPNLGTKFSPKTTSVPNAMGGKGATLAR